MVIVLADYAIRDKLFVIFEWKQTQINWRQIIDIYNSAWMQYSKTKNTHTLLFVKPFWVLLPFLKPSSLLLCFLLILHVFLALIPLQSKAVAYCIQCACAASAQFVLCVCHSVFWGVWRRGAAAYRHLPRRERLWQGRETQQHPVVQQPVLHSVVNRVLGTGMV